MPEALARVKQELGPDAVILGTRTLGGDGLAAKLRRDRVEITARAGGPTVEPHTRSQALHREARNVASSHSAARGHTPPPHAPAPPVPTLHRGLTAPNPAPRSATALPAAIHEHYLRLTQAEVESALAERLVRQVASALGSAAPAEAIRDELRRRVAAMIPACGGIELGESAKSRRVAIVGPPGAGKTTVISKLAAHLKLRGGKRVALLSLDTHRLGASDQIRRFAELINVPTAHAASVSAVKDAIRSLPEHDLLLIDTPGVAWRERGRFARLAALLRAARPDETHAALPASLSPSVQSKVIDTFAPLRIDRVVITRLDEAVGFGAMLGALAKLKWGLSYISRGQRIPDDIELADAGQLADLVLGA